MPKMFGLDSSIVKKGYFPYKFNTPENQDYVGSLPPIEVFEVDKKYDKEAFREWYRNESQKQELYDFREEMRRYCENDVLVLSLSLSAYITICMQYSFSMNPLQCMTIAQFTFRMYQCHFLPEVSIYFLDESFDTFARKSLHGGNTNVRRLLYRCTPEEAGTLQSGTKGLRYIDIQSLYPTVQYYDPMPVGYPRTCLYNGDVARDAPSDRFLTSFIGFIECDLDPIHFIFHPLLSRYKVNKLFMDLHPLRRVTITSAEFQLACFGLWKGDQVCAPTYRYSNIRRIDVYESYDGLFKGFIRNWLKLKIISSKPPSPEKFSEFKYGLKNRLGIEVELNEFSYNESLRTLAKLVLNSLWGKFGQRTTMPQTKIFHKAQDLYTYHEQIRMMNYIEKAHEPVGNVAFMKTFLKTNEWNKKNTAIASFVTANARIRLWLVLHKLDDRVLYHDTDSIIYERNSNTDPMITEGSYLGDWESETGDRMIHEFVALAPKTYAYRYCKEDGTVVECVKSKGFSLNAETQSKLTFDSYCQLLEREVSSVQIPTTFFRHSKEAGVTFTHDGAKDLSFNYTKGFVCPDTYKTYPFGSQRFLLGRSFMKNENDLLLRHIEETDTGPHTIESEEDADILINELFLLAENDPDFN
jgi:hypothetical protein